MRFAAAVLVAALCFLGRPIGAEAQQACDERSRMVAYLAANFDEVPVAQGLAANGAVIEVLAARKGNWTMLITEPNGMACVVASGEAWNQGQPTGEDAGGGGGQSPFSGQRDLR